MQLICRVDVAPLVALLGTLEWRPGGHMIPWSHMPEPVREKVLAVVRAVLRHLPGRHQGTTYLARRVPGERVEAHADAEDGGCRERVHVALVTNPLATLVEAGTGSHLPAGWAALIDPTVPHEVYNGGDTDRIHLFFNAVPDKPWAA